MSPCADQMVIPPPKVVNTRLCPSSTLPSEYTSMSPWPKVTRPVLLTLLVAEAVVDCVTCPSVIEPPGAKTSMLPPNWVLMPDW